jgi:hypothetical protein
MLIATSVFVEVSLSILYRCRSLLKTDVFTLE